MTGRLVSICVAAIFVSLFNVSSASAAPSIAPPPPPCYWGEQVDGDSIPDTGALAPVEATTPPANSTCLTSPNDSTPDITQRDESVPTTTASNGYVLQLTAPAFTSGRWFGPYYGSGGIIGTSATARRLQTWYVLWWSGGSSCIQFRGYYNYSGQYRAGWYPAGCGKSGSYLVPWGYVASVGSAKIKNMLNFPGVTSQVRF